MVTLSREKAHLPRYVVEDDSKLFILVHKPFCLICRHSLDAVLLQLYRDVFLTFTALPVLCVVLSQPPAVVMGNRLASQL